MSVIPNNVNGETHPDTFVDDEDDKVDPKINLTEQTAATAADEEKSASSSSSSSSSTSSAKVAKPEPAKEKTRKQTEKEEKKAASKAAKKAEKEKKKEEKKKEKEIADKAKEEKAKKKQEEAQKERVELCKMFNDAKKNGTVEAALNAARHRAPEKVELSPFEGAKSCHGVPLYVSKTDSKTNYVKLNDVFNSENSLEGFPILKNKGDSETITEQLCDPLAAATCPYWISLCIFKGEFDEKEEKVWMLDVDAFELYYKTCTRLPEIHELTDETINKLDNKAKLVFAKQLVCIGVANDNKSYITEQIRRRTLLVEEAKKKAAETKKKAAEAKKAAEEEAKKKAAEKAGKDEKTKKSTEKRKSNGEETEVKPSPMKRTRVDKLLKINLCPVCAEEIDAHSDKKPCPYTVMDDDNKPSSSSSSSSSSSPSAAAAASASESPKENGDA